LFLFAPVIERVSALRDHDRKAWFPGTGAEGAKLGVKDVDDFHRDMLDLANLRLESRQFQGNSHVAQARKKMGLVLSSWVKCCDAAWLMDERPISRKLREGFANAHVTVPLGEPARFWAGSRPAS
jgi:hypothetical protein